MGVSNCWTGIWNETMEWNDGMEQGTHKVAAKSCNWHCSIQVEAPNVSLGYLTAEGL